MLQDLETTFARRSQLLTLLRVGAMVLAVFGALPLLEMLIWIFVSGPYYDLTQPGIPPNRSFGADLLAALPGSGKYLFAALVLLSLQNHVVRWLVPIPRPECPQCGYDTAKHTEPRCPECGLKLPLRHDPSSEDEST